MKHDAVVRELRALARKADRRAIAGAFLASLGGQPGRWRAPICALAAAERVPAHRYRAFSAANTACRECGIEPNETLDPDDVSERDELLPGDLPRAMQVLAWTRTGAPPVPTATDAERFTRLLALVGKLPANARYGQLADAIRKAKLVPGTTYEVRSVVETLAACGILETPQHPGFTTAWTSFAARQDRPNVRVEVDPPLAFWTAGHGVNATNVKYWFGELGVSSPASAKPRAVAVAKASRTTTKRAARAARATTLAIGEVIAAKIGREWRAGIVIGHHHDLSGRCPIITPSAWRGTTAPTLADVRNAARDRASWLIDLWERNDPKGRWAVIGTLPEKPQQLSGYMVARLRRDGSGLTRMFR